MHCDEPTKVGILCASPRHSRVPRPVDVRRPHTARSSIGRRHPTVLCRRDRTVVASRTAEAVANLHLSKSIRINDQSVSGQQSRQQRPMTPPPPGAEPAHSMLGQTNGPASAAEGRQDENEPAKKSYRRWSLVNRQFRTAVAKTAAVEGFGGEADPTTSSVNASHRPKPWSDDADGPKMSPREVATANRRNYDLARAYTGHMNFWNAGNRAKLKVPEWVEEVQELAAIGGLFDIRNFQQRQQRHQNSGGTRGGLGSKGDKIKQSVPTKTPSSVNGDYNLKSAEHTTVALRRRLQKGETLDSQALSNAAPKFHGAPLLYDSIVNILALATSNYAESRRDAASALNSLSIVHDNKPTFAKAGALPTLVTLAMCRDKETIIHASEAIFRLSMHPLLKVPLVEAGVLAALQKLSRGSRGSDVGCDVKANVMSVIRELCELEETKREVAHFGQGSLIPFVFDCTKPGADENKARTLRREAIWTLCALLQDQGNKISMIDNGSLPRFTELLRSSDAELRRGVAQCIQILMAIGSHIPAKYHKSVRSDAILGSVIEVYRTRRDTDFDHIALKIFHAAITHGECTLQARREVRMTLMRLGGIQHMLTQALSLALNQKTTASDVSLLRALGDVLLLYVRGASILRVVISQDHLRTFMELARSSDSRIRRHGTMMLARCSKLPEAKTRMVTEEKTLPLLLSMASPGDYRVSRTTAKIIAELAEAWQNRVPLVKAGVLSAISLLIAGNELKVQFDCARALADLSEAVDNRSAIVHKAVHDLELLLNAADARVVLQTLRCLLNIVAPAGEIGDDVVAASSARKQSAGRFGRSQHDEYGTESSEDDEYGVHEDSNEKANSQNAKQYDDPNDFNGDDNIRTNSFSSTVRTDEPTISTAKAKVLFNRANKMILQQKNLGKNTSAGGILIQTSETGIKHRKSTSMAILDSVAALARVVSKGNESSWWRSQEGKNFAEHHNAITLDRIHQKLEQTNLGVALVVVNRTARDNVNIAEMSKLLNTRLQQRRQGGRLQYNVMHRQLMQQAFDPL
eukprot:SAG31_NODE_273_length_18667_cov_3.603619_16_plen_1034_part_00